MKSLCKQKSKKKKAKKKDHEPTSLEAAYQCTKCGRMAATKKLLCKPAAL